MVQDIMMEINGSSYYDEMLLMPTQNENSNKMTISSTSLFIEMYVSKNSMDDSFYQHSNWILSRLIKTDPD